MRRIGIKVLKNRLSENLRAVKAGETILITNRGRVVAQLEPPQPGRDKLIREGLVQREPPAVR
jgi:antitoxin (DNA-binding transcriptional repressor) of toxin-antitoxin stability system